MTQNLSAKNRHEIIETLASRTFDLLVIGGGITGAGIALDAASRGMTVALVEMRDFASGTSSKSTKLIHGGLRYLKQFEVGLVREVGRERAIVHRLAPHLVTAEKMLLPIFKEGTFGKWTTSLGLMVYDCLADVEDEDKRLMLTREAVMALEPLLRTDGLEGGGLYAEYRTDDARLTMEAIKTAVRQGAICLNYMKADDFVYHKNKIVGARCTDLCGGRKLEITARYVVSAAGPWVDELRQKDHSLKGKRLFLSKGVHVVVPHERLPIRHAIYFDVPDGRMMFAIPRQRITYIGTTDTPYSGDLNHVYADRDDARYILEGVNQMFPGVNLGFEDLESSWAGLRPLIYEEGKSASEMSRKDEIFESETGLLSIAGGKLTGYRKMAQRIVDLVARKFKTDEARTFAECHTDRIPLGESCFSGAGEVKAYQKEIEKKVVERGLPEWRAAYLVANYGRETDAILTDMGKEQSPEIALARAELRHCLERELCCSPEDFLIRRTGRLYFDIKSIPEILEPVLDDFQAYFNWTEDEKAAARDAVRAAVHHSSTFPEKMTPA
ncbi:MAG: glycerol-3-phosphate dehydrogenase/oxidase [Bacteroidetes bacterium]|nr:MAG: glycerol-3-phosphate dehydrogenase/oxidase [Bacteroidota bacterium]